MWLPPVVRASSQTCRVSGEPDAWPDVVAVVPARNEAEMLPVTLPALLGQDYPGALTVIVVDDGSSDGTGEVAARIARRVGPAAAGDPAVPRPRTANAGRARCGPWPRACARPVRGDYVLFTDADIAWEAHTLRRLVAAADGDDRDLVSQMALLRTATGWERVVVPAFVYFFAQLYPFRRVNVPGSRTAAAAGGCMLVRRGALDKAGGLAPIRGALIDDVALGRLIKGQRGRCWLGLTRQVRQRAPVPGAGQPVADGGQVGLHPAALLPGGAGRDAHRAAVPVRAAAGRRDHRAGRRCWPAATRRRRRPSRSARAWPAGR